MTDLFTYARSERDIGITRAGDAAERNEQGWSDRAYQWICRYARENQKFISEDCTDAAAAVGLISPADPRAWGGPFKKASRNRIIVRAGFGVSKRRHLSPTILWASQVSP